MSKFFLEGYASPGWRSLEVSEAHHHEIVAAMVASFRIVGIEEKFDMLAENYDEFEGELETISRRYHFFSRPIGRYSPEDIFRANRRLINFLSTARLYFDHVDHDLSEVFGSESAERARFNSARNEQYDNALGYRVLEALRNYSQHRDIPIHGLTYGSSLDESKDAKRVIHTLKPTIDVKRLTGEGKFKPEVLKELASKGDHALLRPLLQEYMSGLIKIHLSLRTDIEAVEREWIREVEKAREEFAAVEANAKLYEATERDDEGNVISRQPVFSDFVDHLQGLREKNRQAGNLTQRVRTSE